MAARAGWVEEYVPGWRFYAALVALLAASSSLGLYVASRVGWDGAVGSPWGWLLATVAAALVVPDLVQYAVLRRFGGRPRRVGWVERSNGTLLAWWKAPDHWLTGAQFGVTYGVPALISGGVLFAYVARYPTAAPVFGLLAPFYLANLWCVLVVLLRPGRHLVQPFERGLRFRDPSGRSPSA